jgi:predicted kinase
MQNPTLYLFIGAPGAGKTTTAKIISEATGAVHLWADAERHKLFPEPSHSLEESNLLYSKLNQETERLLSEGQSVVFDTNFNFYADRQLLQNIARQHHANTIIIWMTTPSDIARARSVGSDQKRNGYTIHMTDAQFDAIIAKLEPPRENEETLKIDGSQVDKQTVIELLGSIDKTTPRS